MTTRRDLLVHVSVAAASPERVTRLRELIATARDSGVVSRAQLYECLLQLYLFVGFPASLEAMRALTAVWPGEPSAFEDRITEQTGSDLFQRIYSHHSTSVKAAMIALSPDLAERAIGEGYGKTLSRQELDIQTRELAIVAVLTDRGWHRQLYSHIRGAKNVGADRIEIEEAVRIGSDGDETKRVLGYELIERTFA